MHLLERQKVSGNEGIMGDDMKQSSQANSNLAHCNYMIVALKGLGHQGTPAFPV